ncbi:MAG: zinc-ribbon domain-containing protein [Trueperaceae bacterium]|nr:zinc-ribbon domain-containing protein [Trueperaceae bacterium]
MLWGIKPKRYIVEKGSFKCPKCGKIRSYQRTQSKYYFYLLFIPLFPTDKFTLMDIVTCESCQAHYDQVNLKPKFNKRIAH